MKPSIEKDQRETELEESSCTYGCDEGYFWGSELDDPLWYDADELYPCASCGGTNLRSKMTLW